MEDDDAEPQYSRCAAVHPDPLVESAPLAAVALPLARSYPHELQRLQALVQPGSVSRRLRVLALERGLAASRPAGCALFKAVSLPSSCPARPARCPQLSQAQQQAVVQAWCKMEEELPGGARPAFLLGAAGSRGGDGRRWRYQRWQHAGLPWPAGHASHSPAALGPCRR